MPDFTNPQRLAHYRPDLGNSGYLSERPLVPYLIPFWAPIVWLTTAFARHVG
jgi:hypothetical protein